MKTVFDFERTFLHYTPASIINDSFDLSHFNVVSKYRPLQIDEPGWDYNNYGQSSFAAAHKHTRAITKMKEQNKREEAK